MLFRSHTSSCSHCFTEPCPLSHTPPSASLSLFLSLTQVYNVFLNLLAQVTAPLPFFLKTQLSYFLQKPSLTALVSEWCPYVYLVLRPLYSKLPASTNPSVNCNLLKVRYLIVCICDPLMSSTMPGTVLHTVTVSCKSIR